MDGWMYDPITDSTSCTRTALEDLSAPKRASILLTIDMPCPLPFEPNNSLRQVCELIRGVCIRES